jgi:hypothetical protein
LRKKSKMGWAWEHTVEGRFISPKGSRGVIERIEKTIEATWTTPSDLEKSIAATWATCLARGPRIL